MVFFYFVTMGWIFYISSRENSINQDQHIYIYIYICLWVRTTIISSGWSAASIVAKSEFKEKSELTHVDLPSIPQSGGKMSKGLGGIIIGCQDINSSWHLNWFPMVVTLLGQQYTFSMPPLHTNSGGWKERRKLIGRW